VAHPRRCFINDGKPTREDRFGRECCPPAEPGHFEIRADSVLKTLGLQPRNETHFQIPTSDDQFVDKDRRLPELARAKKGGSFEPPENLRL